MDEDSVPRALARGDVAGAGLAAPDVALLAYAVKLTLEPWAMGSDDVQALREQGFDDPAIHDIAHVTAYYNYVNRMADGLGVELEETWADDDLVLRKEEFEALRHRGA